MLTGLSLRRRVEEVERENLAEHDVSMMILSSVVQDEFSHPGAGGDNDVDDHPDGARGHHGTSNRG